VGILRKIRKLKNLPPTEKVKVMHQNCMIGLKMRCEGLTEHGQALKIPSFCIKYKKETTLTDAFKVILEIYL